MLKRMYDSHGLQKLRQHVAVLHREQNLSKPVEFDGFKNSRLLAQSSRDLHSPLMKEGGTLRCQIGTSKLQRSRSQFVTSKNARLWSQNATLNMDENCSLGLGIVREFRDFGGRKCINHERHEKHEMGMGVV